MSQAPAVVALIAAFNEADVIGACVRALIDDGVRVYLLDHGSTDGTADIVRPWLGRGVIGIETFPAAGGGDPPARDTFDWSGILARKQALAAELEGDWFIHHDADEFRESIWEGVSLPEALGRVGRLGYNAVDFEVLNFRPTDDGFRPGGDPRDTIRYYEPGAAWDKVQVKCWRRGSAPVDLVSSGGHDVMFPGRDVFPLRFLLRHYPIRTQAHGERKVFAERRPRLPAGEVAMGWHVQYDDVGPGRSFVRDPATLIAWDPVRARVDALTRHRGVDALADRLDQMSRRLAWKDDALDTLRGAQTEALSRIETLEAAVAHHEAQAARQAEDVVHHRAEADRLRSELDAHRVEMRRLQAEVRDLRASASWRVTAPLRAMYRLGRRR